mgnify:CR=1 FL=1
MKKSSLTTAVVAGLAGAAGLVNVSNAVNINPDGLGQVLIYPYYTVNEGNTTLLSVVNTTDSVKAVKVRFLEGLNSREVLDFNLYLSPFDVWAASVRRTDAGAAVFTEDAVFRGLRPYGVGRRAVVVLHGAGEQAGGGRVQPAHDQVVALAIGREKAVAHARAVRAHAKLAELSLKQGRY